MRSVSSRAAPTEVPAREVLSAKSSRSLVNRSTTFDTPAQARRDVSPASHHSALARIPSDTLTIRTQRSQLRNVNGAVPECDSVDDRTYSPFSNASSDRSFGEASISPATSHGSVTGARVKGPPPPPPSRAKKPPPPPPPAKRRVFS
jgi:hypothetical protein